jgi:DNA-binding response OmpR family regulator
VEPKRILVVEDEDEIRGSVCGALRDDGYVVVGAATLAEARAVIDTEAFDAIVLDLWLPDGNGDLLLRSLAARPNPPAVVLASAATAAPGIARKFGITHVRKPYQLDALVQELRTAMARELRPVLPPPSTPASE